MDWALPDDFYPGYSLLRDIGYGPEGEISLVRKQLAEFNVEDSDDTLKDVLSLTKDLMLFINEKCKEELIRYSDYRKKEIYIGITLPLELFISKLIVSVIIGFITTGAKFGLKKLIEYIKKKLSDKKNKVDKEEYKITLTVIEKIQNHQTLIKKIEYTVQQLNVSNNNSKD